MRACVGFGRPLWLVRVAVLLAAVAAPARGVAQPADSFAGIVGPAIEKRQLAGVVMLVTDRNATVFVEAAGMADVAGGRPMAADGLFWIASMSKPMTAAAVMMLVDEGKMSLDDPVAKHLPEFRDLWVVAEKGPERMVLERPHRPITIRDVLSHTSGLPFKSAVEEPTLDVAPLSSGVRSYTMMPLVFQPGTGYLYSNAGINTAGRIIEVVSGLPYERFMEERLFRPLGMRDTTFWPTAAQLERLATPYKADKDATRLEAARIVQLRYPLDAPGRQPMPGGGLFSTADDCGRFCRMLLGRGASGGVRVLSEQAVAELARRQTPATVEESYGLGFRVGPDGTFGHGGALATNMTIDPARGIAVVWLVQNAGSPPEWKVWEGRARAWALERFGTR